MSPAKIHPTKPGRIRMAGSQGLGPKDFAVRYRQGVLKQWRSLDAGKIARLADWIVDAQERGRQMLIMGNGGSAATASHIANDLCKTAHSSGRKLLRCVSLSDNVSFITAIGNDLGFDEIFSRQLENIVVRNDLVLLISGSGNSRNLIKAAVLAKKRGAKTAALLGFDGGALKKLVDLPIVIGSDQYGIIEDMHHSIGHILAFYLKQRK